MVESEETKEIISCTILNFLREENLINRQVDELILYYKTKILSKDVAITEYQIYKKFKKVLLIKIQQLGKSEKFNKEISEFLFDKFQKIENSDRNFSQIVPSAFTNGLKVYVYNSRDNIVSLIKEFINSSKSEKRIKQEVEKAVKSINPMVTKFINSDKIYDKIVISVDNYLNNTENVMDIVMSINQFIDKIVDNKISDFTMHIPLEGKKSAILSMSSSIVSNIFSDDFLIGACSQIEEKLGNNQFLAELINEMEPELDETLRKMIFSIYNDIIESSLLKENVACLSQILANNLVK